MQKMFALLYDSNFYHIFFIAKVLQRISLDFNDFNIHSKQ